MITINSAIICIALNAHKSGTSVSDVELMNSLADRGFVLHDSRRMAELLVDAAIREALDNGGTALAAILAETFVDENGWPLHGRYPKEAEI